MMRAGLGLALFLFAISFCRILQSFNIFACRGICLHAALSGFIIGLKIKSRYKQSFSNGMKKYLLTIILASMILPSFAQESIIKDFAGPRRLIRWMNPICLYPSTLRMINIAGDPNFNALVNDIEKILIYTLDSATVASKSYTDFLKDYEAKGYEEYMTMQGQQELRIIGKNEEYVGVMATDGNAIAFYLRGEIPFGKIPMLLQSFQNSDMLPVITDQFK